MQSVREHGWEEKDADVEKSTKGYRRVKHTSDGRVASANELLGLLATRNGVVPLIAAMEANLQLARCACYPLRIIFVFIIRLEMSR